MTDRSPTLFLLTSDPVVVRGATAVAEAAGLAVRTTRDQDSRSIEPAVIVIDLEQPGALGEVEALRSAHADTILVGHLLRPEKERWVAAERAGCDLVANRGAVGRQLKQLLDSGTGRRRFPLVDEDDLAGRLGLVTAVEETPVGTLAVYHIGGQVAAITDRCPHSGARLSEGMLEGCVVTCARHGSQFDVRSGERLRGPADHDVAAHDVTRDGGRVHLVWSSKQIGGS